MENDTVKATHALDNKLTGVESQISHINKAVQEVKVLADFRNAELLKYEKELKQDIEALGKQIKDEIKSVTERVISLETENKLFKWVLSISIALVITSTIQSFLYEKGSKQHSRPSIGQTFPGPTH